jgi:hypothetical protein
MLCRITGSKLNQDENIGAGLGSRGTHHQTVNSGSSEHTGRLEAGRFGTTSGASAVKADVTAAGAEKVPTGTVACILCMECIDTRDDLQRHLLTVMTSAGENCRNS